MHRMQGLLRSPTSGTYPPWLTWGTSCPGVRCSLFGRLVGSVRFNDWYTKHWRVTAFTRGNDLPRNAQTVFGCQCAYRVPAPSDSRLTVSWLPTEHLYYSNLQGGCQYDIL